jgi:hypothetical protein
VLVALESLEYRGLKVGPSQVGFGVKPMEVPSIVNMIGVTLVQPSPVTVDKSAPVVIVAVGSVRVLE